ncbi:hypothetical protein [Geminicoccus flavidas]|uniref:hypothetical protein n=1 Tax=Geminicoccus flavidas TaxID=2506407 RepID=UPI00135A2FED|nr:hypothetical protein [Geminicoccus flavidas]
MLSGFLLTSSSPFTLSAGGDPDPDPGPQPDTSNIAKWARMLGRNIPSAQFGDMSGHSYHWQFTAPMTGMLEWWSWYSQGARPNGEWGDRHARGNYGNYELWVYEIDDPNASNCLTNTTRTYVGQSGNFWPGRIVGGFDGLDSPRYSASGWINSYGNSQSASDGVMVGTAGAYWQSYNTKTRAGQRGSNWGKGKPGEADYDADMANPMPSSHTSRTLYYGTGWPIVPFKSKDANGNLTVIGIPVVKDKVYLVHYKNIVSSPNSNHTHDNQFMAMHNPMFGVSDISMPMDPHLAMYNSGGGRDWRRIPAVNYSISGIIFGNAGCMTRGNSDNFTRIVGNNWVRQQWTPTPGYDEEFVRAWVHCCRLSGTEQGLQGRLVRAPQNTSSHAFPEALSANGFAGINSEFMGWFDFPKSVAKQVNIPSNNMWGNQSHGNPGSAVRPWMSAALPTKARIQRGYHYALELRNKNNSSTSGYWIGDALGMGNRFNRTRGTGRSPIYPLNVWPCLDDGSGLEGWERRNHAQTSTNAGSNWSVLYQEGQEFPICLEPA